MNGEFGERGHEALLKRHAGLRWGEGGGRTWTITIDDLDP